MPDAGGTVAGNPFSAALLARFSESALAQAKNYLIIGGVFDGELTVTPNAQFLQANVRRSTTRHYHVTIQATVGGEVNWLCTCPFATQNCEHTAAVLRVWLQEPQRFTISHDDAPIYLPAAAPMAVTVTPPAAPVAATPSVPAGAALRVTPDLLLYVRRDKAAPALSKLVETLAELRSTNGEHSIYQITGQGLQTALQDGRTIAEILARLTDASDEALPEAARSRLQGWADAQDTFHLYDNLPVVEFADDFALQELLRAGGIRRYLLHIFSPRLVAIHPRHVNDLVAEMERRGLMPKVES